MPSLPPAGGSCQATPGKQGCTPKAPPVGFSPFGGTIAGTQYYTAAAPGSFGLGASDTDYGTQYGTQYGTLYGTQYGTHYGTQGGAQFGSHPGGHSF